MNPVVINPNTSIPETIDWIRKLAIKGSSHPKIVAMANSLKGDPEYLKKLFDWAYNLILYVPDPIGKQQVKTIERLLKDGTGNCVGYTELISSVLIRMGIPHYYDVVSYDKPNIYNHIFVRCKKTILDPVPVYKQDGTDTRQNRPFKGWFNYEIPHKYKLKYYMPQLEILQGTKNSTGYGSISRTRASRQNLYYGHLGCTAGCACQSHLGKTIVGKILGGVADVAVGLANVVVTPIEGIIGTQIIGPNAYSDTGLGNFISKSQQVNSSLNAIIGGVVSKVFTGGSIKISDVDKKTKAEYDQAVALGQQKDALIQQQYTDQQAAQAAFDALNNPANAATSPTEDSGRNKKIIIGLSIAALATVGTIAYMNNNKK